MPIASSRAPATGRAAPARRFSPCSPARTASSVYRALDVLAQLKLVHRIEVDGVACYEPADPSGEHHHHAICEHCGKMDAFEDAELERLIDGVGERLGYSVGAHDIVLRGACPDCAAG